MIVSIVMILLAGLWGAPPPEARLAAERELEHRKMPTVIRGTTLDGKDAPYELPGLSEDARILEGFPLHYVTLDHLDEFWSADGPDAACVARSSYLYPITTDKTVRTDNDCFGIELNRETLETSSMTVPLGCMVGTLRARASNSMVIQIAMIISGTPGGAFSSVFLLRNERNEVLVSPDGIELIPYAEYVRHKSWLDP